MCRGEQDGYDTQKLDTALGGYYRSMQNTYANKLNVPHKSQGFTIVELLIVIVVIAILSVISIAAYTNFQARARDSLRLQDVKTIAKALEMYYVDHGRYPSGGCNPSCPTPKKINTGWATTSDGSWSVLEAALVPKYISELPRDPKASITTPAAIEGGGLNYDYVVVDGGWCDAVPGKLYMFAYNLEVTAKKREIIGECTGTQPTNYPSSQYVVVK